MCTFTWFPWSSKLVFLWLEIVKDLCLVRVFFSLNIFCYAVSPPRRFCQRLSLRWRHNECNGVSNHLRLDFCSIVCSGADPRNHQSFASLAVVGQQHGKCFHAFIYLVITSTIWFKQARFSWFLIAWGFCCQTITVNINSSDHVDVKDCSLATDASELLVIFRILHAGSLFANRH